MTDRPPIPLRRKLLYLGFVTLVMLGLAEAALRARAWVKYGGTASVRDPMLTFDETAGIYVPTPGYELKGRNIHIKINSLGFRGEEIAREKPPGTFRIVCLGASTTFSAEVSSNEAMWTHRLQEKLRAAHPGRRIEVINAAVGGYVSADNLKRLKHHVLAHPGLRYPDSAVVAANNDRARHVERVKLAGRETDRIVVVIGVDVPPVAGDGGGAKRVHARIIAIFPGQVQIQFLRIVTVTVILGR